MSAALVHRGSVSGHIVLPDKAPNEWLEATVPCCTLEVAFHAVIMLWHDPSGASNEGKACV